MKKIKEIGRKAIVGIVLATAIVSFVAYGVQATVGLPRIRCILSHPSFS